jgi:hypothetical protein
MQQHRELARDRDHRFLLGARSAAAREREELLLSTSGIEPSSSTFVMW